MSVTVASFKGLHKEFSEIDDISLQTLIDEMTADTDVSVCGAQTDRVVRLKVADYLARSPFGAQAKLLDENGHTPYESSLAELTERLGLMHGVATGDDE